MPIKYSARAAEVLKIIKDFRKENGHSPSYAAIGKLMRISAPMVFRYIKELRRAKEIDIVGKIIKIGDEIPYSERLLEVLKLIAKFPNATQVELAHKLKIAPPSLHESLQRLIEFGAIDKDMKILDKKSVA